MSSFYQDNKLDKIPSGAVILDSHGVIKNHNPAWLALAPSIGLPGEHEFIGHCYGKYGVITSLVPDIEAQIASLLKGETEDFCVHVACGSDGEQRVLEISAELWGDSHEEIIVQHRQRHFMGKNPGKWLKQEFLLCLFEKINTGVIFQSVSGDIELANLAASKMLGLNFDSIFHPEKIASEWRAVDGLGEPLPWKDFPSFSTLANGMSNKGFVFGVDKSRQLRTWMRVDVELILANGGKDVLGVLSTISDISLERKIHEEINKVTERLRLALDGAQIGIWDWYINEHKMVWDDRMYALYGHEGKENLSIREIWSRCVSAEDQEKIGKVLLNLRSGKAEEISEFCVNGLNGSVKYLRAQARCFFDENGNPHRVVGINWDVTQEVESQRRLKEMAFQDDLTQLPNRVAFNFELNKMIARSLQNKAGFVVLVMDLDNFKDINDSFGHPTGDSVLCEVVNRVTPLLSNSYLFARLSGDEFGILITDDPDKKSCQVFAEKIQYALDEPYYLPNGPAINIKVSIGLSRYPKDASDAIDLIKSADLAMYRSKDNGRDCMSWYDKEMSVALKRKVTMENQIREALRDEEFQLYYQPIVDLHTLEVVGCEALIRWIDKNGKFVSPVDFISVAETCGLIYELGAWVNYTAFKQFKLWQVIHTSLQYVSVNVSPHQLQYSRFVDDLMAAVNKVGINPVNVQLEITEGTFLQESLNASSHLGVLANAGFHLAIDDFGTGYSSLSYLKRFNVDVIKVDKSFIDDIETEQADKDIVKAIMAMTTSLGFKTLVEGVERLEQADIVKNFGCGYGQGYYFGRPLNADEFAETFIGLKGIVGADHKVSNMDHKRS